MGRVQMIDERTPLISEALGEDEALLQIGSQKYVMSYDALYELGFRVAHLLNQMAEHEGETALRQ